MDWHSNLLQTSRTLPVRSSAILGSPGDEIGKIIPTQSSQRKEYTPLHVYSNNPLAPISIPELFCTWRPGRKSSGEPWNKIASDWFQQNKTENSDKYVDICITTLAISVTFIFTRQGQTWGIYILR